MESIKKDITIDNKIANINPSPNNTTINTINTGNENTKVILETVILNPDQNPGSVNVDSIDFSRIALSAQDAINGNFISETAISKNSWNSSNLTYKKIENGAIAIYSGETILGFTDQAGISLQNVTPVANTTPIIENTTTTTPNVEIINTEVVEEQTPIETPKQETSSTSNDTTLQYIEPYNITDNRLTPKKGTIEFNNHIETWYSEKVLPGGGLDIPGRHVAIDGTIRDAEGYICIAANLNYISKGTILMTSLGPAKVYDIAEAKPGIIDIYTTWERGDPDNKNYLQ